MLGLWLGASGDELSAWMREKNENRPAFPSTQVVQAQTNRAWQRNALSFDQEERIAERSLPTPCASRSWRRVVDAAEEGLAVATVSPSAGVTWSFAVYNQLGNLVPYYWTGTGYPAATGSDLSAKSVERAKEILGSTLARSRMLVAANVLSKADTEISMMDGKTVAVPFERVYFVFVDDRPGANWAHPCRYVFFNEDLTAFVVSYQSYAPRIRRISSGERLRLEAVEGTADVVPLKAIADKVYSAANAMTGGGTAGLGDVSRSHFVLISGGADPESNAIRFWADTAMLYSTFTRKYGVPKSQIHVLMSDGGDPDADANLGDYENTVLVDSPTDLDGDGESDVDGAATWDNMNNLFTNTLPKTVTADSQVFVFIVSHGSSDGTAGVYNRSCFAYLYSAEYTTVFSDVALANMTKGLPCPVAFAIETCYSGGFIDDLTATSDRVVLTACDHYESSLGTGGHGRWGSAGIGSTSAYDTWAVALAAAVRGRWPASYNANGSSVFDFPWCDGAIADADADGDGCVDMEEAYEFALENDECRCQDPSHSSCHADDSYVEHPQFAVSTPGLAKEMFFVRQTAPDLGRQYVSMDGDDANDGLSWETAKRTIQSAIDVAEEGAVIMVANGTYAPIVSGGKAIEIRSVNGAASTVIDGNLGSGKRCADLSPSTVTVLSGFTLANGSETSDKGGGAYCGTLNHCVISNNTAQWGGGVHSCKLNNCLVVGNRAVYGGGSNSSSLLNCTVADNVATGNGGGIIIGGKATTNCVIWGNEAPEDADVCGSPCAYTCSSVLQSGTGNIAADPKFLNPMAGNYRLSSDSPCVNAGLNSAVAVQGDLGGNPRICGGTVDMGAYEWQGAISPTSTEFPYKLVNGNAVITNYTGTSKDVVFPATIDGDPVTEIAANAFYYGTYPFVNVTISEGIRKIGHAAFGYCTDLETFSIPSTLTTFGDSNGFEFYGCPAVRSVNVANGNPNYKSVDGVLYNKAGTTLIYCPASKNPNGAFVVPSTVTSIAKYAFNCSKFKTVTLPETITKIDDDVFNCAHNLTAMVVPSGVLSIGERAFGYCYALTSVTIPPSVTSIGDYAFADCRALKTVYVSPGDAQRVASLYSFDSSVEFVETGTPTTSDFEGMEAGRPVTTGSCESLGDSGSCWFASDMSGNESVVCDYGSSDVPLTYSGACGQPGGLAGQGDRYMSLKTSFGSPLWRTVNPLAGTAIMPCAVGDVLTLDFLAILDPCDEMPPMGHVPFLSNGIPYAANALRLLRAGSVCLVDDKLAVYLLEDEESESVSLCVQAGARNATSGQIEERIFQYSPDGLDAEAWNRVTIKAMTTAGCLRFLVYFNGELLSDEAYYAWPQSQGGLSISALGFAGSGCFDNIYIGAADPVFASDDPGPVWPDCVYTQTVAGIAWTYSVDASGDATLLGVSQSGRTLIVPETLDGHDVTAIGNKAFAGLGAETVIVPENIESVGANAFANCRSLAQVDFEGEPPTGLGAAGFPATTLVRYNDACETPWQTALADAGLTNVSSYHPLMDLDWDWEYCDDGVRITGIEDLWWHDYELGEVRIPSSLDGRPVTEIGGGMMEHFGIFGTYEDSFATAITIPDGVRAIGDFVFDSCESLTTVRIPESVTRIGRQAFSRCTNLTNVTLPRRLQSIDVHAFSYCHGLSTVTVPAAVTNLGLAVFASCRNLQSIEVDAASRFYASVDGVLYDKEIQTLLQCPAGISSVEIPKTVKRFADLSFMLCERLESLHIPAAVSEIEPGAFLLCMSLKNLTVDSKNKSFSVQKGILYDYQKEELVFCLPTQETVDILPSVKRISEEAFGGCTNLAEIALPDGVREIGEGAFDECFSLESITIPADVTTIPNMAFYMCRNLKEVQLLGAVTNIGREAFYSCRSLESVTLPASVKHIGYRAFEWCESLALTFEGAPPQVDGEWSSWSGPFGGCMCGYYSACRDQWEAEIDEDGKWHGLNMCYEGPEDSGVASFSHGEASAAKGGAFRLTVYGGSDEGATSVKVAVAYGNAKAADLVLKNATVSGADGVEMTNLKFPLTLSWAAGDIEPKTIVIPVAAGKATDAPKFLTWNLTDAKGLALGETACCIGRIAAGEKWSGEDVYVLPTVADAAGGKVSGGASVKPDKGVYKAVTLKATPNKGYWFAGWYGADGEWASGDLSFKVAPDGESGPLSKYEARFVPAQPSLSGTYNGYARVNLKGMTLVKGADTSADVYGDYPVTVTLSTAGKLSGSITVGGKKVSFKADGCSGISDSGEGDEWAAFRFPVEEKSWFGQGNVETLQLEISRSSSAGKCAEYGVARLGGVSSAGAFAPLGDEQSGFAYRNVDKSDVKLLAPFVGSYAAALDYGDEGVIPLSVSVDKNGKVKASGKHLDGTSLTMNGALAYRFTDEAWSTGTDPQEDAIVHLFAVPKALGGGALHVTASLTYRKNPGIVDIEPWGVVTQYATSGVRAFNESSSVAGRYSSSCWFPADADPDFGVVRLTTGEDVINILYASKNGKITGLGKAIQSGFTVKFDAKTGLLTVTKGKEYTIQGVLDYENGCCRAGRVNKDGTCEPVEIEFTTLPTPEEDFPWVADGFELTLGQTFGEGLQPSVRSGDELLELAVTGLPAGLKYDKKTGLITGAPTKAGEFKVKVGYAYGTRKITRETVFVVLPKPEGLPVGTYAGYAIIYVDGTSEGQRVDCPFAATIDKNGALSGSITLFGKKATFKASGYDYGSEGSSGYTATLDLKSVDKTWGTTAIPVWVEGDEMSADPTEPFGDGTIVNGVVAYRNQTKDAGYADRVAPYVGTYVAALSTAVDADRYGVTTLSATVDKKGTVKLAGTFADGTAFSGSAPLALFEGPDGEWATVNACVAPKSLAQGAMLISLMFYVENGSVVLSCPLPLFAAKYVRTTGEYAESSLVCVWAYRYSSLAWVDSSVKTWDTCLSVTSDGGSFGETHFEWKYTGCCGLEKITGIGKNISGPAMTFKVDEKTGLFSGTCGTYKIFGAMEEGTCSGIGTAVGKDGSVDWVWVEWVKR